jgi:hypothetical protein
MHAVEAEYRDFYVTQNHVNEAAVFKRERINGFRLVTPGLAMSSTQVPFIVDGPCMWSEDSGLLISEPGTTGLIGLLYCDGHHRVLRTIELGFDLDFNPQSSVVAAGSLWDLKADRWEGLHVTIPDVADVALARRDWNGKLVREVNVSNVKSAITGKTKELFKRKPRG